MGRRPGGKAAAGVARCPDCVGTVCDPSAFPDSHSGILASRSRCLRAFQSGITSVTTAWKAGE